MLDRENVINGLKIHTNLEIGCTGCPYNGDCYQLPMDALALLREQEPNKWISAKDRLPEVGKSILYCAFGRLVGEGVYRGFDGLHHVWSMYAVGGTHWDDDVTHWMPLPVPPEEVSGDTN